MPDIFTMLEFLKTEAPDRERAAARLFVEEEPFFRAFPFETTDRAGVPFNMQTALPATNPRAVGEEYAHTQGTVQPGYEPVKIRGGLNTFDNFQIQTGQGDRRQFEAASFIEGVARDFVRDVIKGDDTADNRNLKGLQLRLTDPTKNLFSPGVGPATMLNVTRAKQLCRRPTHWLMGKALHGRFTQAAMDSDVGGYIVRDKDEMGSPVMVLADLPIIVIGEDAADDEILGFDEPSNSTSLYCVSFGPMMMHGVQVGPPTYRDLGLDNSNGTQVKGIVDWYATFMLRHKRAAVRYSGITDAAITL